jgi:hypothetical protein
MRCHGRRHLEWLLLAEPLDQKSIANGKERNREGHSSGRPTVVAVAAIQKDILYSDWNEDAEKAMLWLAAVKKAIFRVGMDSTTSGCLQENVCRSVSIVCGWVARAAVNSQACWPPMRPAWAGKWFWETEGEQSTDVISKVRRGDFSERTPKKNHRSIEEECHHPCHPQQRRQQNTTTMKTSTDHDGVPPCPSRSIGMFLFTHKNNNKTVIITRNSQPQHQVLLDGSWRKTMRQMMMTLLGSTTTLLVCRFD